MSNRVKSLEFIAVFYAAILSSAFFWSLVLLDRIMEKTVSPGLRMVLSHAFLVAAILLILTSLPGGVARRGLHLRNWQKDLSLGIVLGIGVGILFSLFSLGWGISQWNFGRLISQLKSTEGLTQLFSQLFLVGSSEELFFRGLLMTWLMKCYSFRLSGLPGGVVIAAVLFSLVQLYKLLFGFSLGKVLILMVGALFYGLLLGELYYKSKSLLAPILIHNLGNSIMFLTSLGV